MYRNLLDASQMINKLQNDVIKSCNYSKLGAFPTLFKLWVRSSTIYFKKSLFFKFVYLLKKLLYETYSNISFLSNLFIASAELIYLTPDVRFNQAREAE